MLSRKPGELSSFKDVGTRPLFIQRPYNAQNKFHYANTNLAFGATLKVPKPQTHEKLLLQHFSNDLLFHHCE